MEKARTYRLIIVEIISYLYILLFVYAAVSKLIDFENFSVQLGQSPLLSAFAGWVAWAVPVIEMVIAGMLVFPKYRLWGLWAAYCLMVMFTAYIFIILNFSPFVPCSCGGILEKLGWTEHLIFNVAFIVLAAAGIVILAGSAAQITRKKSAALAGKFAIMTFGSVGTVALLFVLSEDMMHHRNNFVRRFGNHPVLFSREHDLGLNSYYIAGAANGKIFLGNVTAPLVLTELDTALITKVEHRLTMPDYGFTFRSPKIQVQAQNIFLSDGTVPCIFKGMTGHDTLSLWMYDKAFFSQPAPVDSTLFAFRAMGSRTRENVLGTFRMADSLTLDLSYDLLKKQVDGIFDTDGTLLFNEQLNRLIYTYYYRNQYIVTHPSLQLDSYGQTIDTTTHAQIEVAHISSRGRRQLKKPPLLVNKRTATYGRHLFVQAALMGKYEPKEHWKTSAIIDVYDITDKSYRFSFYIPHRQQAELTSFAVYENLVIAVHGRHISTYRISRDYMAKVP